MYYAVQILKEHCGVFTSGGDGQDYLFRFSKRLQGLIQLLLYVWAVAHGDCLDAVRKSPK